MNQWISSLDELILLCFVLWNILHKQVKRVEQTLLLAKSCPPGKGLTDQAIDLNLASSPPAGPPNSAPNSISH